MNPIPEYAGLRDSESGNTSHHIRQVRQGSDLSLVPSEKMAISWVDKMQGAHAQSDSTEGSLKDKASSVGKDYTYQKRVSTSKTLLIMCMLQEGTSPAAEQICSVGQKEAYLDHLSWDTWKAGWGTSIPQRNRAAWKTREKYADGLKWLFCITYF